MDARYLSFPWVEEAENFSTIVATEERSIRPLGTQAQGHDQYASTSNHSTAQNEEA